MKKRRTILALLAAAAVASVASAQERKPLSPHGDAAAQVGGKWEAAANGESRYSGGKWIEVSYSRPVLRGRTAIFGSGADYGTKVNAGAPVWRVGANQTTRLSTEVPLMIGGKRIEAGSYDVFVDLKQAGWTLILGTQPTQDKYDSNEKTKIWGSYGYDSKFDVARAPMKMQELAHSVDQFTIAFVDMTENGGVLVMAWEKTAAMVPFTVAK